MHMLRILAIVTAVMSFVFAVIDRDVAAVFGWGTATVALVGWYADRLTSGQAARR